MAAPKLITDLKALAAAIKAHAGKRAKLDDELQTLALSAILAVRDHGNIHYVNALYSASGKGTRHVALASWFMEFGGVSANTGKDKAEKPFIFDREKAVDLESGVATPWFDMKPSQAPDEILDVLKLVQAVIRKAQNPKEGVEVTNFALVEQLAAIVAAVEVEADTVVAE